MIDPVYERHLASLQTSLTTLPDKPEEDAENTLRSLWFAAHGLPVSVELAVARDLPTLNENEYEKLENLVRQRLQGTPLAHLTGRQRFMDLELLAGPEALIPRKETELLARGALAVVKEIVAAQGKAVVVDVCTGSGNIACTIAHYEPNAMVYAADVSPEAVGLAQRNARHIGVHERVTFREGDLLKPFEADPGFGNVDVVTCNPPYIASKNLEKMADEISRHEPRLAFDGGPFGIRILSAIGREAAQLLKPGGWLCLEVGLGQGPAIVQRIEKTGRFHVRRTFTDANGEIRAIAAQRHAEGDSIAR